MRCFKNVFYRLESSHPFSNIQSYFLVLSTWKPIIFIFVLSSTLKKSNTQISSEFSKHFQGPLWLLIRNFILLKSALKVCLLYIIFHQFWTILVEFSIRFFIDPKINERLLVSWYFPSPFRNLHSTIIRNCLLSVTNSFCYYRIRKEFLFIGLSCWINLNEIYL